MNDAELAVAVVDAAGTAVRDRFGGAWIRLKKDGGDIATDVDVAAENIIVDLLLRNRPSDRVTAEESGGSGNPHSRRVWLVDPLCGTLNFVAATGPVAVNVALADSGRLTAAAVADPLARTIDWTDGKGAWRRVDDHDSRLRPSASSGLVDLNLDAASPNGELLTTIRLLADSEFMSRFGPRALSTSLALAWVASGQRAAYVTDTDTTDNVHLAAGIALCVAAGCVVSTLDGGPLSGGNGGLIAAADAGTHESLVSITRRLRRA